MKILHNAKTKICALAICGFFVAGIGLPSTTNSFPKARAEATESVCPIGYGVNVLSDSFGTTAYLTPILDKTFTASDEIDFVRQDKRSLEISYGESYDSYKSLAEDVARRRKHTAYISDDGLFFLHDLKYAFGSFLSAQKYATQYYYRYSRYYSEYSLTLENGAYFASAYSDRFDSEFLNALDRLSAGESSYPEFFDSFGTHVIIGADYGTKFEAYYGCFSEKFLSKEELQEIHETVNASLQAAVESGGEESWNPTAEIAEKYGINSSSSVTEKIDSPENGEFVVIGYSNLLPLYKTLPTEYAALAEPMEKAFRKYAAANTNLYEDSFLPQPPKASEEQNVFSPGDGDHQPLKIALICTACAAAVFAGAAVVGFALYFRKKKKR